jgi:hypothetical protein
MSLWDSIPDNYKPLAYADLWPGWSWGSIENGLMIEISDPYPVKVPLVTHFAVMLTSVCAWLASTDAADEYVQGGMDFSSVTMEAGFETDLGSDAYEGFSLLGDTWLKVQELATVAKTTTQLDEYVDACDAVVSALELQNWSVDKIISTVMSGKDPDFAPPKKGADDYNSDADGTYDGTREMSGEALEDLLGGYSVT